MCFRLFSHCFISQPDRVPWLPPSLHGRSDTLTLLTTAHVFEKLGPLLVNNYYALFRLYQQSLSYLLTVGGQ